MTATDWDHLQTLAELLVAAGTLLLAIFTAKMASATRQDVKEGRKQTAEITRQSEALLLQAEAMGRLAQISDKQLTATTSPRLRILENTGVFYADDDLTQLMLYLHNIGPVPAQLRSVAITPKDVSPATSLSGAWEISSLIPASKDGVLAVTFKVVDQGPWENLEADIIYDGTTGGQHQVLAALRWDQEEGRFAVESQRDLH